MHQVVYSNDIDGTLTAHFNAEPGFAKACMGGGGFCAEVCRNLFDDGGVVDATDDRHRPLTRYAGGDVGVKDAQAADEIKRAPSPPRSTIRNQFSGTDPLKRRPPVLCVSVF